MICVFFQVDVDFTRTVSIAIFDCNAQKINSVSCYTSLYLEIILYMMLFIRISESDFLARIIEDLFIDPTGVGPPKKLYLSKPIPRCTQLHLRLSKVY